VDDESTIVQLKTAFNAHADRLGIDVNEERDAYIGGFVNDSYITASMSSIIKVCILHMYSLYTVRAIRSSLSATSYFHMLHCTRNSICGKANDVINMPVYMSVNGAHPTSQTAVIREMGFANITSK
jgi:hypothetical protein